MMQDEEPVRSAGAGAMTLDRMGVEELRSHIAGLRAEIARAEAEIARKEGLRNAADGVFRRP